MEHYRRTKGYANKFNVLASRSDVKRQLYWDLTYLSNKKTGKRKAKLVRAANKMLRQSQNLLRAAMNLL